MRGLGADGSRSTTEPSAKAHRTGYNPKLTIYTPSTIKGVDHPSQHLNRCSLLPPMDYPREELQQTLPKHVTVKYTA